MNDIEMTDKNFLIGKNQEKNNEFRNKLTKNQGLTEIPNPKSIKNNDWPVRVGRWGNL